MFYNQQILNISNSFSLKLFSTSNCSLKALGPYKPHADDLWIFVLKLKIFKLLMLRVHSQGLINVFFH